MKKIATIIIMCLCFNALNSLAADSQLSELSKETDHGTRYAHIGSIDGSLDINSSGKATVIASAAGDSSVAKTTVEADLMQYKNGRWIVYRDWSETNNKPYADIIATYYVPKGYSYKVVARVYVYDEDGGLLDSVQKTTKTVRY